MDIQPVSFTSAYYYPDKGSIIMHIAYNHVADKYIKADELLKKLNEIDLTSTVSLFYNRRGKTRLAVEAGDKVYKENMFNTPLDVLRKAVKHMTKLSKQQHLQNEQTKGMHIPTLK